MNTMRTLEEIKEAAEKKVEEYNALIVEEKYKEAFRLMHEIDDLVGEYSATSLERTFAELKATEDPMLGAVLRLTYPTIKAKDAKKGESAVAQKTIEDSEKTIDLRKLHKYCGGIGTCQDWIYSVEKFNFLLTLRTAEELGIRDVTTINDSFAMSELSRQRDLGQNPCSNTKILATYRRIIGEMIGEEYAKKITSHDVAFLLKVYNKKGKAALAVNCANHRYLTSYIAETCHKILTEKEYIVEFKAKKA